MKPAFRQKIEELTQSQKLILLNSTNKQHTTALYLDKNKVLHFFDPNSGETCYSDFNSFVGRFWQQLDLFISANLTIEIFSLNSNLEDQRYYKDKQQFKFTATQLSALFSHSSDYLLKKFLQQNTCSSNIEELINNKTLDTKLKKILLDFKRTMQDKNPENIEGISKNNTEILRNVNIDIALSLKFLKSEEAQTIIDLLHLEGNDKEILLSNVIGDTPDLPLFT